MQAAKAADTYGLLLPGNDVQQADANQAYTQAPFVGETDTYVRLPNHRWPKWWREMYPDLKDPVCRLHKALYGHPDSPGLLERHLQAGLAEKGFEPIAEN